MDDVVMYIYYNYKFRFFLQILHVLLSNSLVNMSGTSQKYIFSILDEMVNQGKDYFKNGHFVVFPNLEQNLLEDCTVS